MDKFLYSYDTVAGFRVYEKDVLTYTGDWTTVDGFGTAS